MLVDFHCHFTYPGGIVCTDHPCPVTGGLVRSVGLLPSKWSEEDQDLLFRMLREDPALQLGEIGLDRRFVDRIPMERQIENLRRQLAVAVELGRSVSLHCVQATGPMLEVLSSVPFRPYRLLWHGFTGSKETASRLSSLKVMISIGPRTRSPLSPILKANGHYVIETDYEGSSSAEHLSLLDQMYSRLQTEASLDREALIEHCNRMLRLFSVRDVQIQ